MFEQLKKHFAKNELGLFHGRFLFIQREQIEQDCIAKFGKPDKDRIRPHRYVLVATQVIEQSLDLDFDLMISDLAPVDLLLQRSGRLHRHEERKHRPAKLTQPTLWLIAPRLDATGKANFGDAELIYDRHVLLRTWLALRGQASVQLPTMMDSLIESVYNLDLQPEQTLEPIYLEDWQASLEDYHKDSSQDREKANEVKLPPGMAGEVKPSDFTRLGEADDDNTIAKVTRLGRESITTIFLQQSTQGLVLAGTTELVHLDHPPNLEAIRRLLEHSTRLSQMGLVAELHKLKQRNPKSWTSVLLRHCCYVVLNSEGKTQVDKWQLCLDGERGVVIERV